MFMINYKINSDQLIPSELAPEIYGFIELLIGSNAYGCYPKSPVPYEGSDLLSTWFEQLSENACLLEEHSIVIINDITSYNTWLSFNRIDEDSVEISELLFDKPDGIQSVITQPIPEATLGKISNIPVKIIDFKREVFTKTSRFLNEVLISNPLYRQFPWVIRIQENLSKII
ncbi:hypothetical protein [Cohnella boryungensis]|uniref:Uncharacterized protein n=1 Tax=Cohnella boryungensis TaxID=768479 RepID=A0ABV8SFG4_9BACL